MVLEDPDGMALGTEPIYSDGKAVGYVTSTNYGYYVDKHIVYGYLPSELSSTGTKLELEYFGKRYPLTVTTEPLLDPENSIVGLYAKGDARKDNSGFVID